MEADQRLSASMENDQKGMYCAAEFSLDLGHAQVARPKPGVASYPIAEALLGLLGREGETDDEFRRQAAGLLGRKFDHVVRIAKCAGVAAMLGFDGDFGPATLAAEISLHYFCRRPGRFILDRLSRPAKLQNLSPDSTGPPHA